MPATARYVTTEILRICLVLCVCSQRVVLAQDSAIAQEALWESGKNGYHTYRIPALAVTSKGTALAFCEGRKNRSADTGDIDLLMRRSADDGRTWPLKRSLHSGPSAYSDLAVMPDGSAACLYERGTRHPYEQIVLSRFKLRDLHVDEE